MDVADRARDYALAAYGARDELEHPEHVRDLVSCAGGSDDVQAAAYLHDLVEDTPLEVAQIESEFGPHVAAIVEAMTENEAIEDYLARKEEHRTRARDAGRDVALLFVADKLSNARRMRAAKKEPDPRKIAHYGATLDTMRAAYPDLPLLPELATELERIRADLRRSPA